MKEAPTYIEVALTFNELKKLLGLDPLYVDVNGAAGIVRVSEGSYVFSFKVHATPRVLD